MPEATKNDERLTGALLVAATLTAAIRLRGEPVRKHAEGHRDHSRLHKSAA